MKIVILDGHALNPGDLSWDEFENIGQLEVYDRTPAHQVISRSKDAEVIFTNKTPLSAEVITQLPALKFIGVLATGYNVVDIEAARNKGIVVSNIPGYGTSSVVQMTFALLLELCHRVQRHSDSVFDGMWTRSPDWCYWNFPLTELADKTIGIVGFGSTGAKVADVATAFGMKVIAFSRSQTDQSHRKNFKWVEPDELYATADVVSLHCPLVPETRGLINKDSLGKMKCSAFLINTSRGPVINEQDLADALNSGVIAGAAVDVLSEEPPNQNNPLLTANNCVITPHIAWATFEARSRLIGMAVQNLHAFVQGRPVNVVNG